ncbi:hypothetical protein [Nonomuraea dietziae]|uniref:hypothetical protein n=1 Tax=Nonomuraea dietziae TaxID=65515 RepID=UPI00341F1ED5
MIVEPLAAPADGVLPEPLLAELTALYAANWEFFALSGDRTAIRLAVLDNNPKGLAFWTTLGYEVLGHREDRQHGRPCTVMRKKL